MVLRLFAPAIIVPRPCAGKSISSSHRIGLELLVAGFPAPNGQAQVKPGLYNRGNLPKAVGWGGSLPQINMELLAMAPACSKAVAG